MTNTYLENCINVTATANNSELPSFTIGEEIGRGGDFRFNSLGKLTVFNSSIHVGLKTPIRDKEETAQRFLHELALIHLITDQSPGLLAKLPRFMALLLVSGNDEPTGILTEDVSKGGTVSIEKMQTSKATKTQLYNPFKGLGPMESVLVDDSFCESLSFRVGGDEMLLDFTPRPVTSGVVLTPEYKNSVREITRHLDELTVTLSGDSALALSLER